MSRGVRWIGWGPGDGYGDATVQYLAALEALGVSVTWTPLVWAPGASVAQTAKSYAGPLAHLAGRMIDHDTVVFHLSPDRAAQWLGEAGDRRTVCVTTWETDQIPDGWARHLASFDAVVVPSAFNRDVLIASGCATPVYVVPHVARIVGSVVPAQFERMTGRYVFYVIATWSTRKAMSETVSAFLDAFDSDDDVGLVVKSTTHNQLAVARVRRGADADVRASLAFAPLLAGRRRVPEIRLITGELPAAGIDALHARGDCFFSLTRSEGWGLCIADAVLFGNPVVVTGWGGHLDYLGADYQLLVDYDLVPTSTDPVDDWLSGGPGDHRWARARHEHAVELLRWVAEHREQALGAIGPIRERLARECAPGVIGRRLLDVL